MEVFCKKSIFKNFCKKAIFKNLAKFIEKEPVPESLFRKVADLQIATLLKTGSKTGVFANVAKYFKNNYLAEYHFVDNYFFIELIILQ